LLLNCALQTSECNKEHATTHLFDLVLALRQFEEEIFVNGKKQKARLTRFVEVWYMCVQITTATTTR